MDNWSGNVSFGAARIHRPATVEQLAEVVAEAEKIRAVGSAHSFNDLVDTAHDLISTEALDAVLGIDAERATVTVEGGIRYHQLCAHLQAAGWALPNLPSIPHFSVAGACATATHGSGDTNQELAAAVAEVELVTANGSILRTGRADPDFGAVVVSLGALGVVSRLILDIEPSYTVAQEIHLETPLDRAIDELDEIMAEAYSVSWFLDWRRDVVDQIWRKHRVVEEELPPGTLAPRRGGTPAQDQLGIHGPAERDLFTTQLGVPGPWHERLPHLRTDRVLEPGGELQSEYFVPRSSGRAALEAVAAVGPVLSPVMRMSEIRSVAASEQWLSPFAEDRLALHFSWTNDWPAVRAVLPRLEDALAPFEPRPHWGKLHEFEPATVRGCYPRFDDFVAVTRRFDPTGTFRNRHLDRLFG